MVGFAAGPLDHNLLSQAGSLQYFKANFDGGA